MPPLCRRLLSPCDTWLSAGLYLYLTWSGFVSCVWALRSPPCFCVCPGAERGLSGGRRLSQTSAEPAGPDAAAAAAAASEAETLHLAGGADVFFGSLAADLQAPAVATCTPAVFETAAVFDSPVSSVRTGAAFEDLAVELERRAVSFWVRALDAEFVALDDT